MDNQAAVFYAIFVIQMSLPTRRRVSVAFGIALAVIDLIIAGVCGEIEPYKYKVNGVSGYLSRTLKTRTK